MTGLQYTEWILRRKSAVRLTFEIVLIEFLEGFDLAIDFLFCDSSCRQKFVGQRLLDCCVDSHCVLRTEGTATEIPIEMTQFAIQFTLTVGEVTAQTRLEHRGIVSAQAVQRPNHRAVQNTERTVGNRVRKFGLRLQERALRMDRGSLRPAERSCPERDSCQLTCGCLLERAFDRGIGEQTEYTNGAAKSYQGNSTELPKYSQPTH